MKYFKNLGKKILRPLLLLLIIAACGKNKTSPQNIPPTTPGVSDSTDLESLPHDLGGTQTPVYLNNNIMYGYYVYTPSTYTSSQANYPLLVYLHGTGEIGNSKVNQNDLKKLLDYGPPELISKKKWSPRYPMIVVSPQTTTTDYDPDSLNNFIKYLVATYKINTHRIYLTGISLGGHETFKYLQFHPKDYVAAAIPMSASYFHSVSNLSSIPIWGFCGGSDQFLPGMVSTLDAINQFNPAIKPKITAFPGVGHNCWDLVYSGSGMGTESKSYDPFNMTLYDWLFQYAK